MKHGDKVRVFFTEKSIGVVDDMKPLHDTVQTIDTVHNSPNYGIMYSLVGCESEHGLPYWFVGEWLTPVREGEEI
jgi:hypothetical protein